MVGSVVLPTQDQLFAYYTHRCGCQRVRRPNAAVLQLLENCVPSPIKTGTNTPLAERLCFRLPSPEGCLVHVGSRGMLALLDLVAVLPLLEELDLSNITSWYAADAFPHKSGVTGNDVVRALCQTVSSLPRVRRVSLAGQPIGTQAAYDLLEMLKRSPQLTTLEFDSTNVDASLCTELYKLIARRRQTSDSGSPSAAALPLPEIPQCVASLPRLDRKTLSAQQLLRVILEEEPHCFGNLLTDDAVSELVLKASIMSVSEVTARCPDGVRGDGHHLFIIKSGAVRAYVDRLGLVLRRGDFFGDTYANALFPRCDLAMEEEGLVYCIPLSACAPLRDVWAHRVDEFTPVLRSSPFFQAVDPWSRVRTCTCAVRVETPVGRIALRARDPNHQLFVVSQGIFLAMPGDESDRLVTGRFTPVELTQGDVFGMEALVSNHGCSSVPVVGGAALNASGEPVSNASLHVTGCAVRCLVQKVHPLLFALARPYSVHDDLRLTAKRRAEKDPVAEYMYII